MAGTSHLALQSTLDWVFVCTGAERLSEAAFALTGRCYLRSRLIRKPITCSDWIAYSTGEYGESIELIRKAVARTVLLHPFT